MAGLNQVQLIGNLGGKVELNHSQSGRAVASLSLATNEVWRDKEGQKQERVEWHRVVVWGPMAETCGRYLTKGSKVFVQGRLTTRKWTDKNNIERWSTEVVADEVLFLDSKGNGKPAPTDPGRPERGGDAARDSGRGGQYRNEPRPEDFGPGSADVPF